MGMDLAGSVYMALCCKMYYYLRVLFLKYVFYELLITYICFVEGYVFSYFA